MATFSRAVSPRFVCFPCLMFARRPFRLPCVLRPCRYQNLRYLGGGAYGTVCSAEDALQGNKKVAIKKISEVFRDLFDAKRILREILLLRHLGKGHENLLWLSDVFCWPQPHSHSLASLDVASFRDIYLVTDVLDTDLSRILESKQTLTGQHCKYFCYQLIRGLHYLHSAGVLHRDLKPSNLLVNANCELVIADLGLARPMSGFLAKESAGISRTSRVSRDSSVENEEEGGASGAGGSSSSGVPISAGKTTGLGARAGAGGGEGLTSYVVTRWYRAPELLLQSKTCEFEKEWPFRAVFALPTSFFGHFPPLITVAFTLPSLLFCYCRRLRSGYVFRGLHPRRDARKEGAFPGPFPCGPTPRCSRRHRYP